MSGLPPTSARPRLRRSIALASAAAGLLLAMAACSSPAHSGHGSAAQGGVDASSQRAESNPQLDAGTTLHGQAPDFRLTNQFGQQVSLSAFRGKVVILAFTDSECTNICPLTTASMVAAKDLLGKAGNQVQLLGIDANPDATKRSNVMAYSRSHGMINQWDFLTGSQAQLHAVWKAYHIYVQIVRGDIDHTPALYLIDPQGRERKLYLTTMAYTTVGQAGQLLAQEASSLLPSHPKLASQQSLAQIKGVSPATSMTMPGVRSGSVSIGPGKPRLVFFFATWLDETSDLKSHLADLNGYVRAAKAGGLPQLVGIDEAVTEPSAAAVRSYLTHAGTKLRYPVGLDTTGRIADGYGVQDQPWFMLVSGSGKVLWKHDGWLSAKQLEAAARAH
ncbi:MAG TPA: SCO family protein [Streptosporangiaceae bacterium]|nr:SCO family protein [Streptosporangiaceae bacterium]